MLIPNKHSGYLAGIRLYPGGGKGGNSAPAPDPALIAAQIKSMGYQDSAIQQMMTNAGELVPIQKQQMQFGLDSSKTAYGQAQDDRTFALGRRDIQTGLQNTMAQDAKSFNTQQRQDELAGQAIGDVNQGFSAARGQQDRGMARMGVNPSSGRALAMGNQMSVAQAAAQATAANKTRQAARQEGFGLTDRANSAMAGYSTMASGNTGQGAAYGAAGLGMANSGLAGMNSGYNAAGGMAGNMGQNAGSMYNTQANNAYTTPESTGSMLGGIGGLAMGAAKLYGASDRRLKENIVEVGTDERTKLPLYEFSYKAEPGRRYRGFMADEVEVLYPDAVRYDDAGFAQVDYGSLGTPMIELSTGNLGN